MTINIDLKDKGYRQLICMTNNDPVKTTENFIKQYGLSSKYKIEIL